MQGNGCALATRSIFQVGQQQLKLARAFLSAAWMLAIACANPVNAQVKFDERMKLFRVAYKSAVATVEGATITMRDGTRLTIDDGQEKNHQQRLNFADIEDMLSQVYPMLT